MKLIRFISLVASALSLMMAGQSCQQKEPSAGGDKSPGGEVILTLTPPQDCPLEFSCVRKALVNGTSCEVSFSGGKLLVGCEKAPDGNYSVIYPADAYSRVRRTLVLPPAQFLTKSGGASAQFHPFMADIHLDPGKNKAETQMKALTAFVDVNIKGAGKVASVSVSASDGSTLSGTFVIEPGSGALVASPDKPELPFAVVNCAGAGEGTDASRVIVAVPAGVYGSGLDVRVTSSSHKCATSHISALELKAGEGVKTSVDFSGTSDIIYEEHFDNCVWGSDYVGGKPGYGPSAGEDTVAPANSTGQEVAYHPKAATIGGSDFIDLVDYNTPPAQSQSLKLSKSYLGNTGLLDYQKLFYFRTYQGYIGSDESAGHANRPLLRLPILPGEPCEATLSLRFCSEKGCESDFECEVYNGVLLGLSVDSNPIDVSLESSTIISQANSKYHVVVVLPRTLVGDGKWHTLEYHYGAMSPSTGLRILPQVVKGARNCYFVDDIVIKKVNSDANRYKDNSTRVSPTDQPAKAGENTSSMRLQPSFTTSIDNESLYSNCPGEGIDWMCGGISDDESLWATQISNALSYRAKYGDGAKIWSSHLPYGYRGTERNRDLAVPDPALHQKSVAFYKRAIRAIGPMHPKNVLIHCNQTLLFDDGSSADMIVASLVEIVPVADSIGAHICVENMSWGVGADVDVLCDIIDRANAQAKPKYPIRIAMDTGHANLYLNTVGNRGTIVDWARTAGERIGHLHVNGNRATKVTVSGSTVKAVDDHLFPGYEGNLNYYDKIGRDKLWGAFYKTLLDDCHYRGPFSMEISSHVAFGKVGGEDRYDHVCASWYINWCYDSYIYPSYRKYIGQ